MPGPLGVFAAGQRAENGIQEELTFSKIPAADVTNQIGALVRGAVLGVGVYEASVPIGGIANLECHLTGTIGAGTCTSDVFTTFFDGTTKKTGFAAVGALVSATRQTSTLAGPLGSRVAIVRLTVVTGPTTMTQAEINGA